MIVNTQQFPKTAGEYLSNSAYDPNRPQILQIFTDFPSENQKKIREYLFNLSNLWSIWFMCGIAVNTLHLIINN
jgi:hypothetical protein